MSELRNNFIVSRHCAFLLQIRFWILQLSLPFPVLVPLGEHTTRGGGEEERERDTFCLFFSSLLPIPMRKEGEREREREREREGL